MQLSDRIGCRMKLHDLHVFMAVVQAGSMSKAAALLNTGQPAISRSIAELEHSLGVRLLDRSRQGITPTEYGRTLLDGGTAVFDDLRQAVKSIELLGDPSTGEVRIGCNPLLAATFVSAAVDRLSLRYPRVVFRLVTGYVEALYRELTERNVDLVIARRFHSVADERFHYEILFDDSYAIVAGAHNPWARRRGIDLAELVNEPWALPPPESGLGSIVMNAFRACGLGYPRTTVIGEPAELRISMLATGRFISISPYSAYNLSARRPELKVLAVRQSLGHAPVGIVMLKNRTISPLVQLFINNCRELAKQLAKKIR